MYDCLVPEVIATFSAPGEREYDFLRRVRDADLRVRKNYATSDAVCADLYADPTARAAYLLRYLGHYALQLGDLLNDLEQTEAASVLATPALNLAALCGGPCPEAIALATLHQHIGGRSLQATVLDLHADNWADCWPIIIKIIEAYPKHPSVSISGLKTSLFRFFTTQRETDVLRSSQVLTCMNCLNELIGINPQNLAAGLRRRLARLQSGSLVLATDQAGYRDCQTGLQMLKQLLLSMNAKILIEDLDPSNPHQAENRFTTPERIAWMYSQANANRFRIFTRQLRLAALIP